MTSYCSVCAEEVVDPVGDVQNDYLIIEEFPYVIIPPAPQVLKWKKDEWTPRKIVANELTKVGMVIQQFHIVSVFPHRIPDNGMPNENCYQVGLENVVTKISKYKGVIVLGTNLCKEFTGYDLKSVCGLSGVDSKYIPDGDVPRVFLPSINSIFSTGSGEFGIGLRRFAKQLGVPNG